MAAESPAAGCPAPSDSQMAELAFDGVVYIVSIQSLSGDTLEVSVEQKDTAERWTASFAAAYLEEITAKTGNFKRFPVFVKMLLSAVRQESESVFVDLLTYSDLELLRSKRRGSSGTHDAAEAASKQPAPDAVKNKRYLILTYAAEFDRVHYPLPLLHEENPDPAHLKAVIAKLRAQIAAAGAPRSSGAGRRQLGVPGPSAAVQQDAKQLRDENAALTAKVQQLQAQLAHAGTGSSTLAADVQQLTADTAEAVKDLRCMRKERDALLLRVQQAEAALEGERNLHRRELRRRVKELQDAEGELDAAKEQIRELRLKCRELVQELDLAQRRARVANLSSHSLPKQPTANRSSGSRASLPGQSRGISPSGSRFHSRDVSPAPLRRAPMPGQPPRSRSADVSRAGSQPSSRPSSAGRFDPTEYVKLRKEREREAARRQDDMRRAARLGSLPGSRSQSVPTSRHSTPQRMRGASRDPSAGRSWVEPLLSGSGREQARLPQLVARDGGSSDRLRASVSTTRAQGFTPLEQRAISPGRALLEVRQRLQQYAHQQQPRALQSDATADRQRVSDRLIAAQPLPRLAHCQQQQQQLAGQQRQQLTGQQGGQHLPRPAGTGDHYADASAEIADIDSRLQSLQNFLKAAKAGQAAVAPA